MEKPGDIRASSCTQLHRASSSLPRWKDLMFFFFWGCLLCVLLIGERASCDSIQPIRVDAEIRGLNPPVSVSVQPNQAHCSLLVLFELVAGGDAKRSPLAMGKPGDIRASSCTQLQRASSSLPRWRDLMFFFFFWGCLFSVLLIGGGASCGSTEPNRVDAGRGLQQAQNPPVSVSVQPNYVVLDNGILQLTLAKPGGFITGLAYGGIDNLMEVANKENDRGYWSIEAYAGMDRIMGASFEVILQSEEQVEISFTRTWDHLLKDSIMVPLSIDIRYIVLRGHSGFYTYGIFEHLEGWPGFNVSEVRTVFKVQKDKFHYMAMADNRQRIMPMPDDRLPPRGQPLAYKEAVQLIDPINPDHKGEVDDKYQYSCDNKDSKVHGWICQDPFIGFWLITPSIEFRTGGPIKQDLTSHVGPTTLAMFVSTHYAGTDLGLKIGGGEHWKKVFGPIFLYLNSAGGEGNTSHLWNDAKSQMQRETESWPYSFPVSEDYPAADKRGSINGKLLVRDRYLHDKDVPANNTAYVGLAPPGEVGSWQRENKGYQFWTKTERDGSFNISNVRTGVYNLYAWVQGVIGDYKYHENITITSGSQVKLSDLLYEPPRDGPTLWEIGIPDRSAAEFYVPDPNPMYINKLYVNHPDRFRQYGLWERYAELYPNGDLVYTIGTSDYKKDWFYAHVTRKISRDPDTYHATTWQIKFNLDDLVQSGPYKLQIALAAAKNSELQVRINDPKAQPAHFSTGVIGDDNSIARHGIHGLYWLFNIDVKSSWLTKGDNIIFLTQVMSKSFFQGVMYDYIRLEGPPKSNSTQTKYVPVF